MASGDTSSSLDIRAGGEIHQMTDALNTMVVHIKERAQQARDIASGNLAVNIDIFPIRTSWANLSCHHRRPGCHHP